ncbi:hypothetical protein DFH11DRAFT_1550308 [Phellopilus nigrolimitatus]|nr:hypothetical protein DFH11DRAFT_1550308 [Phellopilus nigrolimitatus]
MSTNTSTPSQPDPNILKALKEEEKEAELKYHAAQRCMEENQGQRPVETMELNFKCGAEKGDIAKFSTLLEDLHEDKKAFEYLISAIGKLAVIGHICIDRKRREYEQRQQDLEGQLSAAECRLKAVICRMIELHDEGKNDMILKESQDKLARAGDAWDIAWRKLEEYLKKYPNCPKY